MTENHENSAIFGDQDINEQAIKSPLLYQLSYMLQDDEAKGLTSLPNQRIRQAGSNSSSSGADLICCVCGKAFRRDRVRQEYAGRHCCSVQCAGRLGHKACMESFSVPDSDKASRTRAQGLVNKRLKLGWFNKPTTCCLCHQDHQKISAHHCDYAKPDSVHWVCPGCHLRVHHDPMLLAGIQPFICDRKNPPKPRHSKGGKRIPPDQKKKRPPQITIRAHHVDGTDVIEVLACGHAFRRPDDGRRQKQRRCFECRDGVVSEAA